MVDFTTESRKMEAFFGDDMSEQAGLSPAGVGSERKATQLSVQATRHVYNSAILSLPFNRILQ
jgi:hypothetical protein